MTAWLVVPTAGTRTQLLEALVEVCGLPRDRIVVVTTAPFVQWPDGVHHLEDLAQPVNIHRWWNTGIKYAEDRGATVACVFNDDIVIGPDTVDTLVAALEETGATLACASTREPGRTLYRGDPMADIPPRRVLDGACWALDLSSPLRPDESYSWWFGDNEMDFVARRDLDGVVTVATAYEHKHPSEATFATPALQRLAQADEALFRSRWLTKESA